MIRCIIIEDSKLARIELREMLKQFDTIEIVAEAENAEIALIQIKKLAPDLLFLDIQMPGKSGFDLLAELDTIPAIIFTTAYDQYAAKSFEYNTVDYLLKPISNQRLQLAVERATQRIKNSLNEPKQVLSDQDSVFIKDGEKCYFVKLKEIYLLESQGNYTQVFFDANHPLVHKSLSYFESKLDSNLFFRVNRSQIINLKYISKVVNWFNGKIKLKLINNIEVEVSRRQTDKIKNLFSF